MALTTIKTIDTLKDYLYTAMQLEHATIPPYLTALYSIRPGTNSDAFHILRVVLVEEMLHLTIAANLLNSIGGEPTLIKEGFVPTYPTPLPDGEEDFQVGLERFSKQAINTFLKIERPSEAPDEERRRVAKRGSSVRLVTCPDDRTLEFYSIGEFYEEIRRGFALLYEKHGPSLFSGDSKRQVGPEYYYSGGGELRPVTCMNSAQAGIDLIIGQGEGKGGGIYDSEGELAHYYRFDQLIKGRYYQQDDTAHEPTGPTLAVDWESALPIKTNARVADYSGSPELQAAAVGFNRAYGEFLATLTKAYNGEPQLLMQAVPKMFHLRDEVLQLMNNPLPDTPGQTAAPTFEIGAQEEGRQA